MTESSDFGYPTPEEVVAGWQIGNLARPLAVLCESGSLERVTAAMAEMAEFGAAVTVRASEWVPAGQAYVVDESILDLAEARLCEIHRELGRLANSAGYPPPPIIPADCRSGCSPDTSQPYPLDGLLHRIDALTDPGGDAT